MVGAWRKRGDDPNQRPSPNHFHFVDSNAAGAAWDAVIMSRRGVPRDEKQREAWAKQRSVFIEMFKISPSPTGSVIWQDGENLRHRFHTALTRSRNAVAAYPDEVPLANDPKQIETLARHLVKNATGFHGDYDKIALIQSMARYDRKPIRKVVPSITFGSSDDGLITRKMAKAAFDMAKLNPEVDYYKAADAFMTAMATPRILPTESETTIAERWIAALSAANGVGGPGLRTLTIADAKLIATTLTDLVNKKLADQGKDPMPTLFAKLEANVSNGLSGAGIWRL